jgi:hypothetical protein
MIDEKEQLYFFLNLTNLFFFVTEMQCVFYGDKNET